MSGPQQANSSTATLSAPGTQPYSEHVVKTGDTLFKLAKDYYGDGNGWPAIRDYNGLQDVNLKVGQHVRIPLKHVSINTSATPESPQSETFIKEFQAKIDDYRKAIAGYEKPSDIAERIAKSMSAEASPQIHSVAAGDSLKKIAAKYYGDELQFPRIQAANNLGNSTTIHPDQKLIIPEIEDRPLQGRYVVKSGDNLRSISMAAYGSTAGVEAIRMANKLNSHNLTAGQTLVIPDESKVEIKGYYIIKSGDNLERIAREQLGSIRYADALQRLNDLDPKKLVPGQRIRIPAQNHVVRESDNLFTIARLAYGDTRMWPQVIKDNPSIDPLHLPVGKTLFFRKPVDQIPQQTEAKIAAFLDRPLEDIKLSRNTPAHVRNFVNQYKGVALEVERETGIPAIVTLAQAGLESAWGEKAPGNNLFGIKAANWNGAKVNFGTHEYEGGSRQNISDDFRAYANREDSVKNYGAFLATNRNYEEAFSHTHNPNAFASAIGKRYATDPSYTNKVQAIMASYFISTRL